MDKETEKELDYINNEIHMRMKKEYSDGAMIVSFSLIYFATVTGILLKIVEDSAPKLINIAAFAAMSIIFYLFPILIYYSTAMDNRENLFGIISLAAYKRKFVERYELKDGNIAGNRWENFHKDPLIFFFGKEKSEVFYLSFLSLVLYCFTFLASLYFTIDYARKNEITALFSILIVLIVLFVIFFILGIKRLIVLGWAFNMDTVTGESASVEIYYEIENRLIKKSESTDELNLAIKKLKEESCIFAGFLDKTHISLHKAVALEKEFYSEIFPEIFEEELKEEKNKEDVLLNYYSNLAQKRGISLYQLISDYSK